MLGQLIESKKSIDDVWPLSGKRVLLRVDFNVPIEDGIIMNDYRIRSTIPTIRRIIDQNGICIILSHLGRPVGVDCDAVDAEHRRRVVEQQHFQKNRGKTEFFSNLCGEDKSLILSWSSERDKAASLSAQRGSGKTAIFSRLGQDEKWNLLERFKSENKERAFPQLATTSGFDKEYSLELIATRLAELLGQHVYFAKDCLYAKNDVMKLKNGEVVVLENVRFYNNENSQYEEKRLKMAAAIASYGDVYIDDAFATAHRDTATNTGLPKIMGHGAAGYLMEKELYHFAKLLNKPSRPMLAIIGGVNLEHKMELLKNLFTRADVFIMGGGVAYSFLKAQGYGMGACKLSTKEVIAAGKILSIAQERKVEVMLPIDHVCSTELKNKQLRMTTEGVDIPDGYMGLDIGPKTIAKYVEVIAKCKSAIWNGPMGVFEMDCYSKGTFAIAKALAEFTQKCGLLSVISGADTVLAVERSGEANGLSHVSTGGVASVELLEGKTLPGVQALDNKEEKLSARQ